MRALYDGWNRFWFEPTSTATLGVFRVLYGLLLTLWTLSMLPDAVAFFSSDGVLPEQRVPEGTWTLLALNDSPAFVTALVLVLLVAAIALTIGYHSALASVVTWVILVSLRQRNIWVMNGGDGLMRHFGFFLMLAPTGAALSFDRWRRHRASFWHSPLRPLWGLRLIQIQTATVYLFTLYEKVSGERWRAGTAVASSMRAGDLTRFAIPLGLTDSLLLANILTFGTLAIELALAVLIWNRVMRPYVIAAGIVLHLFIEVTFSLGFFSFVMCLAYLSFVPGSSTEAWLDRVRLRLGRPPRTQDVVPEAGPAPVPAP